MFEELQIWWSIRRTIRKIYLPRAGWKWNGGEEKRRLAYSVVRLRRARDRRWEGKFRWDQVVVGWLAGWV